ncbi:hypothetical protein THRCLA_02037 [Thraustotheca clavata]|uniref:MARVEL domain-containing protein n=1 Tax=Thraustotheca clavata TaxID=74557 RepID=A0A1W0A6Q3_9STRA|nr:hypothetical protein THRCLA_02037 [Thraustotheca clavata]
MNRRIGGALRGFQACCGVLIVATTMLTYDTFQLIDGDQYRYAQTYQFVSVVVGYTTIQYGVLYIVFVISLRKISPDVVLERFLDGILVICSIVCGYMAQRKILSCNTRMFVYQAHCDALTWSAIACFVNAGLFILSLLCSFCNKKKLNPDATQNLVPRGNYGPSIPMLSPRNFDDDNTDRIIPRGNFKPEEDRTDKLVPRGNFALKSIEPDEDKTEKLVPRGNFIV